MIGEDFPLDDLDEVVNEGGNVNEEATDSDEDQIEQYSQSAVKPLNYKEMPTPVCDGL